MNDRERFSELWEDLYDREDEIVAMGVGAIEFLLEEAERGKSEFSAAASILCRIGVAEERVIAYMREQVSNNGPSAGWAAKTLALLGDIAWLLAATDTDSTRAAAVAGIVDTLGAFTNLCPHTAALDYDPVETLLAKNCEQCTKIVEESLVPGCDHRDITVAEVDEAIRALSSSPHAVIRRHAAMVLGGRGFGAAAKKKIAPALVQRFNDEDPQVKRLSVLSLSYLPKSAAKPFRDELEALLDDPDLDVILFARNTLEKIG